MISITIDASVLALPPENDDLELEYWNINQFYLNIFYLRILEKCPSITVSYMNKIPDYLQLNSYFPENLKRRTSNLIYYNYKFNLSTQELEKYYTEEIRKKLFSGLKDGKIGKLGIYENIPRNYSGLDENKYRNISYDKTIYHLKELQNNFEIYLGYISELNSNYHSEDENYIAINVNNVCMSLEIIMRFDNNKKSRVNIIGVQNTQKIIQNKEFANIKSAFEEIKTNHSLNLNYGNKISVKEIKQNIGIDENSQESESDFAIKLYWYLLTLNKVMDIVKNHQINIRNDDDFTLLINSHGCLCSPDSKIYKQCKFRSRYFINDQGNEEYFSLHLKPITYNKKSDLGNFSRRIYFKLDNMKILIGWIGRHLLSCSDCEKITECHTWKESI